MFRLSATCHSIIPDYPLFLSHFSIDEDASAELANDDFFALTDIQLALCGYFAVATAATVSLHLNDRQSVVCVFADTLESSEETLIDIRSFSG